MRKQKFTADQLRKSVRFTDPVMFEKEQFEHLREGTLAEPYLVQSQGDYLIFNGNHRVIVAINNGVTIYCNVIENDEDVVKENGGEIHLVENYGGFSTTKLSYTLSKKNMV